MAGASPRVVVVFSGKRKSGKDHTTDLLKDRLGYSAQILRLSGPLKFQYAKENGLDGEKLLDASAYKEQYRADMIAWGEAKRKTDPGFFCRLVCEEATRRDTPVWIVSDARRGTDLEYFQAHYSTLSVRVEASEQTRQKRGWVFTKGVDDGESECGLDGRQWDVVVTNDGVEGVYEGQVDRLVQMIREGAGL
eukprot:comp22776_c1_seq1/m.35631 comp22776_c1_seq1/g.35631  ORF comp22776_c1_seq1/g.35631 comp22776_c1_seq1/m.35631 type:complete len:192 (-) comp22776_c1_seq1:573-1148(-)